MRSFPKRFALGYSLRPTASTCIDLYRHIVHPDLPRLAFIGNASSISSVLTYSLQARWLGDLLSGRTEQRLEAVSPPETFDGQLRPYQARDATGSTARCAIACSICCITTVSLFAILELPRCGR
jgi:hypothetical protein